MSGKAKPQKHTAKEIAMKAHEAKMKKGGRGRKKGTQRRKEKYFYQVHYLLYHATFR